MNQQTIVTKIQSSQREQRMTELAAVLKDLGPSKDSIGSRVRMLLASELARLALESCQGAAAQIQPGASKEDRAAHRGNLCDAWRCAKDKAIAAVIPTECKITVTVEPVIVRGLLTIKPVDGSDWAKGGKP